MNKKNSIRVMGITSACMGGLGMINADIAITRHDNSIIDRTAAIIYEAKGDTGAALSSSDHAKNESDSARLSALGALGGFIASISFGALCVGKITERSD